ncbi:MAG TPA: hypothetical protein VFH27_13380 [Longimicrobiaceae bacterium]|nr:hypothetical protein [Longimicrobiaceae bacterium]
MTSALRPTRAPAFACRPGEARDDIRVFRIVSGAGPGAGHDAPLASADVGDAPDAVTRRSTRSLFAVGRRRGAGGGE